MRVWTRSKPVVDEEVDREHQELLGKVRNAKAKLMRLQNEKGWDDADDINLRGGPNLGPWKWMKAFNIGYTHNDGETNAPMNTWIAQNGRYYAHNTWFRYVTLHLSKEPKWMLRNLLAATEQRIALLSS